jgi:cysteine sulfinate desulfinase/cysteine desulfurase-like protein
MTGDADQAGPAGASAVRPYTWTRGRTKSGTDLAIETLVSTSQRGRDQMGLLQVEHRAVAELCEHSRSTHVEVSCPMEVTTRGTHDRGS